MVCERNLGGYNALSFAGTLQYYLLVDTRVVVQVIVESTISAFRALVTFLGIVARVVQVAVVVVYQVTLDLNLVADAPLSVAAVDLDYCFSRKF